MYLKIGYWKNKQFTDDLFECYNRQENCENGCKAGNNFIDYAKGYIGPLCETWTCLINLTIF